MNLEVDIHGLGILDNIKLNIKPLTVIAGENSTGKSFATKSIYCVLDALNKNHTANALQENAEKFIRVLTHYERSISIRPAVADEEFISSLRISFNDIMEQLVAFFIELNIAEQEAQKEKIKEELGELKRLDKVIDSYLNQRGHLNKIKENTSKLLELKSILNFIVSSIDNYGRFIAAGISEQLSDNFKKNYQVTEIKSLINTESGEQASIKIQDIGSIELHSNDNISFTFDKNGIVEVQKLENVVFIDSPVYLRIRKGLERKGLLPMFRAQDDRYLKGYPSYIDNLYTFIDRQYLDKPDFHEISQELQAMLAGKLAITKSGEINYVNYKGVSTPLSLTAMGISNLGLIDLLIRNNIIKPGSFLIIDEPEAHIHPKWQVVFMELLYKMAQAGANVIIATHSLDMIKKLELLAKQESNAEELVSVHKMPSTKLKSDATLKEKIEEVLEDLSTPFYQMYMEDLE